MRGQLWGNAVLDPYQMLSDVATALVAGGIAATLDARDLTPPGVLVELESVAHNILGGNLTVRARLLVITGDAGTLESLKALGPLYAAVTDIVSPNTEVDSTAELVTLPNTSSPLPCFVMHVDLV